MNERDELAQTIHSCICEESLNDCLEWRGKCLKAAEEALAAGYRRPRTISTVEELDALPGASVVKDALTQVFEKQEAGVWHDGPHDWLAFDGKFWDVDAIHLPATVLHEPEARP